MLGTVISALDGCRGELVIPPRDVYINEPVALRRFASCSLPCARRCLLLTVLLSYDKISLFFFVRA